MYFDIWTSISYNVILRSFVALFTAADPAPGHGPCFDGYYERLCPVQPHHGWINYDRTCILSRSSSLCRSSGHPGYTEMYPETSDDR